MATRLKCVITFLAAVMVVATAACASAPPGPIPNIDATIEAGIAATVVGVAIEKGGKATMAPSAAKEHFTVVLLTASWATTNWPSRSPPQVAVLGGARDVVFSRSGNLETLAEDRKRFGRSDTVSFLLSCLS